MAKKKQILFPVLFMVVLTAIFTFVLATINEVTTDIISEQQELSIQKSIFYTFNISLEGLSDQEIQDKFEASFEKTKVNDRTYYTYTKENKVQGYAVQISGKGLWGTITGHVAFSPDHEKILGLNFISHSETPGLGGRIDEDEFKDQFRSITLDREPYFSYGTDIGGNVDAITGATLTSLAVRDILNGEIPKILEEAKKEGFYEGN
ncbi:MAG: FMN-binding protein [Clostridia bacterium]|nr:FMN-binding protein [Clostridia bacterium]